MNTIANVLVIIISCLIAMIPIGLLILRKLSETARKDIVSGLGSISDKTGDGR